MYEKANSADLSIVIGVIVIVISLIISPWWSIEFFTLFGVGAGLLALGFLGR